MAATMFLGLLFAMAQVQSGAWSSGRPPECGDPGGRAANAWERAKSPELRRYCDLVASAASKLSGVTALVDGALEAAREADRVLPGHGAPPALEGRALAAIGKYPEALAAFSESRRRDPRALDDPPALLAFARALARSGQREAAGEAYRALLPRAVSLTGAERAAAQVEAGLVAMERGPAGLDEAVAALREAAREAHDGVHAVAVLALGLALDRRGDVEEARALLSGRTPVYAREALATTRAKELLAVAPGQARALLAIALDAADPPAAREEWQKAVEDGSEGAWAAHARAHLAALAAARTGGPR